MAKNERGGEPKFRDIFREMAENTSLHGIPKVVSSKYKYQKIFWVLLLLGTTGFLSYQVWNLFSAFYQYPVKTSVELKFSRLRFPAVSFCNMNPIKKSLLHYASKDLQEIIKGSTKKDQRDLSGLIWKLELKESTSSEETAGSSGRKRRKRSLPSLPPLSNVINTSPVTGVIDDMSTITEHLTNTDVFGGATIVPSIPQTSTSQPGDCGDFWSCWFLAGDTNDPSRDSDLYSDSSVVSFYEESGWNAPKDKWQERVEKFKVAFQNESLLVRTTIGHEIEDMLMACTFDTKLCYAENFTFFHSVDYGNCYTISQPLFITKRTGPLYGLELTINIEQKEYITNFATGYGLKLVIHEPGTLPFPAEEGLTLDPGYETTIGLKMVNVKKLGPPYGDCDDGQDFKKLFGIEYSRTACIQLCKQQYLYDNCGCLSGMADTFLMDDDQQKIRVCDPFNDLDFNCETMIAYQYDRGSLECVCERPCEQKVFEKIVSGREWPNADYLKYGLLVDFCAKNLSYAARECAEYQLFTQNYTGERRTCIHPMMKFLHLRIATACDCVQIFTDNFLRVKIYYEDLNYEHISESPMYDGFRFVSDIGGTLGLFMGASILSFVEVVQFFFEVINYLRKRAKPGSNRVQRFPPETTDSSLDADKTTPAKNLTHWSTLNH